MAGGAKETGGFSARRRETLRRAAPGGLDPHTTDRKLQVFPQRALQTDAMKVRFVVLEPESKRGTYEVPLPIVVGRGNEARFRIQQDRISRKHCELFDRDGDVYVRDLGSTNGTFLDGEQIAASIRTHVPPGSVLGVGTIEIRIDYQASGRLAPAQMQPQAVTTEPASTEPVSEHATIGIAADEKETMDRAEPAPTVDAGPAVDAVGLGETRKAPQPDGFGELEIEEPAIEAFPAEAFGEAAEAEPVDDGSFDFLASSKEEPPADDDKLGDFFKGLQ